MWVVRSALKQRYGGDIEAHRADVGPKLTPGSEVLSECPALSWTERGAGFVVINVGEDRYRTRIFYDPTEQFGTGRDEYDEPAECVATPLQVQAHDEKERAGVHAGDTADDIDRR